MDTGLLGAMIGATLFGALLSWWERGPDGLATSKRSEARHLLPWVGLRLLAALVAARGLITVLTWPAGRALGALCFLFSLPYLFPWPFARLAILRGRLGWAEGLGRLAAAHFRGATHLAGLAARAWAAWLHDDQVDLRASTERLEAWSFGPESVLCRAALAELSGNPDEARLLLDSLDDFGKASLSIPLRPWLQQLRAGLPEAKAALAAPDEGLVPPAVATCLDDDAAGVDEWRTRWADEVDVQSLLAQARKQLAQWVSPPSPAFAPSSADWGAELEAFRARSQHGGALPIALEWTTWCTLRDRAQSVGGPQGALRLRELWDPASYFAVRLWAEPGARPLAAAVLRWLERRARELDDSSRYASASRQLLLAS